MPEHDAEMADGAEPPAISGRYAPRVLTAVP
jgi:hypothetical protein